MPRRAPQVQHQGLAREQHRALRATGMRDPWNDKLASASNMLGALHSQRAVAQLVGRHSRELRIR